MSEKKTKSNPLFYDYLIETWPKFKDRDTEVWFTYSHRLDYMARIDEVSEGDRLTFRQLQHRAFRVQHVYLSGSEFRVIEVKMERSAINRKKTRVLLVLSRG